MTSEIHGSERDLPYAAACFGMRIVEMYCRAVCAADLKFQNPNAVHLNGNDCGSEDHIADF
jgi:hypothetical protein